MRREMLPAVIDQRSGTEAIPALIGDAGDAACFVWEEFFSGEIRNPHTRRAYRHAVRQFIVWCEGKKLRLQEISPGLVGNYLDELGSSLTTKKQHLAALRGFFDKLVLRHVVVLNPAASVRAERYQVVEGKAPEITVEQARTLLRSIRSDSVVGLRDRAIIAVLVYTAAPGRCSGQAEAQRPYPRRNAADAAFQ